MQDENMVLHVQAINNTNEWRGENMTRALELYSEVTGVKVDDVEFGADITQITNLPTFWGIVSLCEGENYVSTERTSFFICASSIIIAVIGVLSFYTIWWSNLEAARGKELMYTSCIMLFLIFLIVSLCIAESLMQGLKKNKQDINIGFVRSVHLDISPLAFIVTTSLMSELGLDIDGNLDALGDMMYRMGIQHAKRLDDKFIQHTSNSDYKEFYTSEETLTTFCSTYPSSFELTLFHSDILHKTALHTVWMLDNPPSLDKYIQLQNAMMLQKEGKGKVELWDIAGYIELDTQLAPIVERIYAYAQKQKEGTCNA